MSAATMHRSPYGLTADRADPWQTRAACDADTAHLFAADHKGPLTTQTDHARAGHVCSHCAVVAQCYQSALASPPLGMVQAGRQWMGRANRVVARLTPDPGCGPWCAGLRGAR